MPTFSIIIPAYNSESTILRCLDSIIEQVEQDFEVIVVNDCSTDSTAELVRGFTRRNIKLLTNEVNSGPSFSRNEGLRVSTGDFVAFLDSDDYWLPSHLHNVLHFARDNSDIDFFYTGVMVRKDSGYFKRYSLREVNVKRLLMRTPICTSSVVIRRSAVRGIYFREVFYDDLMFWYEVLSRCKRAVRVDGQTAVYVITKSSYSSNKLKSSLNVFKMYRRNFNLTFFQLLYYYFCYNYFGLIKTFMQNFLHLRIK